MPTVQQLQYKNIRYLMYLPNGFEHGKQYPLFFHLHGAGGRGNDFVEFKGSTILAVLEKGNTPLSDCVCVFPQCSNDTWFDNFQELLELAEVVRNLSFVDKKRVTASGISMGGYGIYQVMMCKPELFNKAVVCCGGGMYWNAGRMKNIKFKIFHGEQDLAIFPEEAKRMYARLKESGADVELTLYPECDHNCWDKTYTNPDVLKWIAE